MNKVFKPICDNRYSQDNPSTNPETIGAVEERMLRENAAREAKYRLNDTTEQGDDEGLDLFLSLPPHVFDAIYREIGPVIDAGRKRRRPADEAVFQKTLSTALANASVALGQGKRCHYSRGKGRYKRSVYNPDWITSAVITRVVDRLAAAGYLIKQDAPQNSKSQVRSVFSASPSLEALLSRHGVTVADIDHGIEVRPALVLKDSEKKKLEYNLSEKQKEIESIRNINRFICSANVAIARNGIVAAYPLTPLRRIYNEGSFSSGGRFYGGNWQNERQKDRNGFLFDGLPTTEIDLDGCMPRMMYHQMNKQLVGPPYYVEKIYKLAEAQGMDMEEIRNTVKTMFAILINSKNRKGLHKQKLKLPKGMTNHEAFTLLEERHSPIRYYFFKQESRRIMNMESEICRLVLEASVEASVLVLPVHDSYIVRYDNESWLRETISEAYKSVLGYEPTFKPTQRHSS